MVPKVVQVKPTSDFKVFVYFDDGKIKLFDMNPFLNKGVFQQISNATDFIDKCTVMNGALAWDLSGRFDPANCLDIDPVTIYRDGVSVEDPLKLGVG
jgi:hypothetical protein